MAVIKIRLPAHTYACLQRLARTQNVSINKLFEQWSTMAIAEFDAEMRFRAMAMQGSRELGLSLLDKLDVLSPANQP